MYTFWEEHRKIPTWKIWGQWRDCLNGFKESDEKLWEKKQKSYCEVKWDPRFWKWRAIGVFKMEMWYDEGHILGRLTWYVDAIW